MTTGRYICSGDRSLDHELLGAKMKSFSLAAPCGMRDPSSPSRDRTHAPCIWSADSQPLDCQGSPKIEVLISQGSPAPGTDGNMVGAQEMSVEGMN